MVINIKSEHFDKHISDEDTLVEHHYVWFLCVYRVVLHNEYKKQTKKKLGTKVSHAHFMFMETLK